MHLHRAPFTSSNSDRRGEAMETPARKYRKLSKVLHPDHGGKCEHFQCLKELYDQCEASNSKVAALEQQLSAARETGSRAQTELAKVRGEMNSRLAAHALAAQAQYTHWYQHRLAQDMADMQKKHCVELESVRNKLRHVSEQWQECHRSEQRLLQELQRARQELEALKTPNRKRNSDDPLEELFEECGADVEMKRLRALEEELKKERLSQRSVAKDWRTELTLREAAVDKRETEMEARESDVEERLADTCAKEAELARLDNAAIENVIKEAELSARSLRLDREQAEYEEKMRTEERNLCDKAAHLQVKEEELAFLLPAYEACAQVMEDFGAVDGAVKYLVKQKETLNKEIERIVKKHTSLAQSFQRLQAEVMAPPVEP